MPRERENLNVKYVATKTVCSFNCDSCPFKKALPYIHITTTHSSRVCCSFIRVISVPVLSYYALRKAHIQATHTSNILYDNDHFVYLFRSSFMSDSIAPCISMSDRLSEFSKAPKNTMQIVTTMLQWCKLNWKKRALWIVFECELCALLQHVNDSKTIVLTRNYWNICLLNKRFSMSDENVHVS